MRRISGRRFAPFAGRFPGWHLSRSPLAALAILLGRLGDSTRRTPGAGLVFLLFFPLLVIPSSVRAQEPPPGGGEEQIESPYRWIEGSARVAPFLGYLRADRGQLDLGPGPTVMGGVRARARISSPLSLSAGLAYGDSERFVVDPRLEGGPAVVDTVPDRWVLAEAGIQLSLPGARSWHGLQPYVEIGAGFVFGVDEPKSPVLGAVGDSTVADFRFDLGGAPVAMIGAGVELDVSEKIGIGLEARDHLWRLTAPDGFFRVEILNEIEEAGATAPTDRDWTHNLELSVGLWYYF